MKYLVIGCILGLGYSFAAVASLESDVTSLVPKSDLSGIKLLSCEKKPDTYRVSCNEKKQCTVSTVSNKINCKAVKL